MFTPEEVGSSLRSTLPPEVLLEVEDMLKV